MNVVLSSDYASVRRQVNTGDVVFFDGKGGVSSFIRLFAGSPSHAGFLYREPGEDRVRVLESTSLKVDGHKVLGVQSHFLSDRIDSYRGRVWIAKLCMLNRRVVDANLDRAREFIEDMRGRRYDFWQMFREGWKQAGLPRLFPLQENYNRLYCSELVAAFLKHLGILPHRVNPSSVSPGALAAFSIYNPILFQVSGKHKDLRHFNTVYP